MNVISIPLPIGVVAFSEAQVKQMITALGFPPPPGKPVPGIPDFTDEEVGMIIEDGGNVSRVLAARRYH